MLVGGARAVRPAFIRADIVGLVGRDEVGKGNQFPVALADGERERAQVLHLAAGTPLEGIPHLDGSGRFDIRAPNALGPIDVAAKAAGKKTSVHGGAHELVVFFGPARSAELVASSAALAPCIHVAGIVRLTVQSRLRMGLVENLSQIPVIVVLAHVSGLLQGNPRALTPVLECGWVGIRREQRAEWRRSELLHDDFDGGQVVVRPHALANDVQVNRAENRIVGLIPGPDVLNESRVGIGPSVVLLPQKTGITPRHLDEGDEPLLVQVIDLAIQVAKVLRVDAVHIGKHVFIARDFAGENEGTATLVVHILGAAGADGIAGTELEPRRAYRSFFRVVHDDVPRLPVGHPVGKRRDDVDPVVTLRFAVADVVFEPGLRSDGALPVVVVPFKAIGAGGIPGVADDEEWRAIRQFQSVTIGCGAQEAPAQGVVQFLGLGPVDRDERPGFPRQALVRGIGAASPGPGSGRRGHEAHPKREASIPEPVDAFLEVGAGEIHINRHIGIGVRPGAGTGEGQFLFLPNMHGGRRRHGGCG